MENPNTGKNRTLKDCGQPHSLKKKREKEQKAVWKKGRAVLYLLAWCLVVLVLIAGRNFPEPDSLPFFFRLPCLAHDYFHLYCPGCGGTTAMLALLKGNIKDALRYSPFLVYLAGLGIWYLFQEGRWLFGRKEEKPAAGFRYHTWMVAAGLGIFFGYCLVRNIALLVFGIDWTGDFLQ